MPATYSISVGGPTEALRKQDINSVLLDLPDNTQKLISPRDVRDAFVTTWANSAFKQTIGKGAIEYLGIDSGNPDNRDIKQKILLGKRNFPELIQRSCNAKSILEAAESIKNNNDGENISITLRNLLIGLSPEESAQKILSL